MSQLHLSKKYILLLLSAIVLLLANPNTIFATSTPQSICPSFDTVRDQLSIRFSLMQDKITLRRSTIEERMQRRHAVDIPLRDKQRASKDILLQKQFTQLREQAQTENESIAVEEYIALTTKAYVQYRDVVDLNMAASEYIDTNTLHYYDVTEEALNTYKDTLLKALDDSTQTCATSGMDINLIRSRLKTKVANARSIYEQSMRTTASPLKKSILSSITLIQTSNTEAKKRLSRDMDNALQKLQTILTNTRNTPT